MPDRAILGTGKFPFPLNGVLDETTLYQELLVPVVREEFSLPRSGDVAVIL